MAEDNRLATLAVEVSFLRNEFTEVKTSLKELAKDMSIVALAVAERESDRKTTERLFKTIEDNKLTSDNNDDNRKNELHQLEIKLSDLHSIQADKLLWSILKWIGAIVSSIIIFKLTTH